MTTRYRFECLRSLRRWYNWWFHPFEDRWLMLVFIGVVGLLILGSIGEKSPEKNLTFHCKVVE